MKCADNIEKYVLTNGKYALPYNQTALIQTTKRIYFNGLTQPVNLPKTCIGTDDGGLRVFAVGIGDIYANQPVHTMDGLLRQTTFSTCFRDEYDGVLTDENEPTYPPSVILAQPINGNDIGKGDSGSTHLKLVEFFLN